MLATKNLKYTYNDDVALSFPDIECQKGERWLLLGQSGSGKTTLLHLLGGLRTAKDGDVIVNGTSLKSLTQEALDQFRGQHIGIIFQKAHFIKALTVEENLALAQSLADKPVDRNRIKALLDRLNVSHKLKSKPDQLSIGEQQRVAIARALVNKPAVILADEPTSALDDVNCDEVVQLLEQQAAEENATLLIVTHDGRLKEKFEHQIILNPQV